MISMRRRTSLEGCMGGANSPSIDIGDRRSIALHAGSIGAGR